MAHQQLQQVTTIGKLLDQDDGGAMLECCIEPDDVWVVELHVEACLTVQLVAGDDVQLGRVVHLECNWQVGVPAWWVSQWMWLGADVHR